MLAPAGVSVSPFGLPAFNRGMIATGNHNFEKFAALCNTLSGKPRRLRRSGRLRASPTMGGKGASHRGTAEHTGFWFVRGIMGA